LRHWSAEGHQLDFRFLSDLETLWSFSQDGRLLASASDELSLWEVGSGRFLTTFDQPSWITALAFSADSRLLASGHDDGIIRLWELGDQRLVGEFPNHQRPISALAFGPDGRRLASAGEDKLVRFWDIEADRLLGTCTGHHDRIHALAWHPQGRHLVSAGWDTTARVWDTTSFEPKILLNCHAPQVLALAFSPDGRWLASADSQQTIYVWDFSSTVATPPDRAITPLRLQEHEDQIHCLAFAADGLRLASGGADHVVRLSNLAPRVEELSTGLAPEQTVAGEPPQERGIAQNRQTLALSADGTRLASAHGRAIEQWQISSGASLWHAKANRDILSLVYDRNGRLLAGGSADASIQIRDAAQGHAVAIFKDPDQNEPVTALAFSPDSLTLASASNTGLSVWLWNVENGEPELLIPDALDGCTIESLAFHPQGRLLAAGGIDWLATGGSDGAISLWDLNERCEVATFDGGTLALAMHSTGRWLASASLVRSICIWDLDIGELSAELLGHEDTVNCVAYSPDGQWLASGSDDRSIRLWEAATGRHLATTVLDTQIKALAFSPDSRTLFTANGNRTCYQLDLGNQLGLGW
jgi:WD40 repeat protein